MKRNISSIPAGALALLSLLPSAQADRSSANYKITAESFSPGGGAGSSSNYQLRSSLEPLGGRGGSANYAVESGWTGFEHQVIGLTLEVLPIVIEEGDTARLSVTATLDDRSLLAVDPDAVQWSIEFDGFVTYGTPIQRAGVLAPLMVEEDSVVSLHARYGDLTARTVLTVVDDDTAGLDLLAWQRRHFGDPEAPEAQLNADPDGDGSSNRTEYLGGFDPTDPNDRLALRIISVRDGRAELAINKVIPNRRYTVWAGSDLVHFRDSVTSFSVADKVIDRVVVDRNATQERKFYRLEVTE